MEKSPLVPWLQQSPLGRTLLVARPDGALLLCTWPDGDDLPRTLDFCKKETRAELAPLIELAQKAGGSLDVTPLPASAARAARALDEFLCGRAKEVSLPVDLSLVRSEFRRQILTALHKVPAGTTTTYLGLGKSIGRAHGAARSVGQAVAQNPLAIVVPCHRVLASDGSLGGFSGGLSRKRWLLQLEGYRVPEGGWESRRSVTLVDVPV